MKFIRITSYQNKNNPTQEHFVNKRLEYFHHYWTFLLTEKPRWIFFTHERLESHRSLFTKIDLQLDQNIERYPPRIRELTLNHPYFQPDNIVVRDSRSAGTRVTAFKTMFNSAIGSSKVDKGSRQLRQIQRHIKQLKKSILGTRDTDYSKKIIKLLIKVLHDIQPLNGQAKEDIKFLVNASIIELYHLGYSLRFIRQLPTFILFPAAHVNDFPFEKTRKDFDSDASFDQYKKEEIENITLKKQLAALHTLATMPKRKGYYIFQVKNFEYSDITPLTIWDVTFYNPQHTSKLGSYDDNEVNEYCRDIEKYFEQYVKPEDQAHFKSSCNAIVPAEYRPLYFTYLDESALKAIQRANSSLAVLKNFKHLHSGGHSTDVEISLKTIILTDADLKYYAAPTLIDDYKGNGFSLNEKAKNSVNEKLAWLHKLDQTNHFHQKITNIIRAVYTYRHDPLSFSFKDFWITVADSLFPSDHDRFTKFCCHCISLYLKDKFLAEAKMFLHDALKREWMSDEYYTLSHTRLKRLGLEIQLYKPIRARKHTKFQQIDQFASFSFLDDLIGEITKFGNSYTVYNDEINQRLKTMIYEVYAERNLEVHNNHFTDFSLLKLKEFCINLAVVIHLVTLQKINSRIKSIQDLEKALGVPV